MKSITWTRSDFSPDTNDRVLADPARQVIISGGRTITYWQTLLNQAGRVVNQRFDLSDIKFQNHGVMSVGAGDQCVERWKQRAIVRGRVSRSNQAGPGGDNSDGTILVANAQLRITSFSDPIYEVEMPRRWKRYSVLGYTDPTSVKAILMSFLVRIDALAKVASCVNLHNSARRIAR